MSPSSMFIMGAAVAAILIIEGCRMHIPLPFPSGVINLDESR